MTFMGATPKLAASRRQEELVAYPDALRRHFERVE